MKKSVCLALVMGVLFFVSCSDNDDDKKAVDDCQTCNFEFDGLNIPSEICDNGDGTITITTFGEEEIEDLDGITFAEFIATYEQFGATCD